MTGSSPSWSIQQPRWVSRGWTRSQLVATAGAVAGGVGAGRVLRVGPGRRACPGRSPGRAWAGARSCPGGRGGFGRRSTRSRAQPPDQLHGQVGQHVGEPGDVVAGVGHDHDVRVAGLPLPGRDQPVDDVAQLGGGHRGRVVGGAEPDRVQHRGPRGAPGFQGGDERVRPARDHLRAALPAAVDVAEQPVRAGRRVRAQPRADIHGQHDPPIGGSGQRQRCQRPAQPLRLDPALVERVVHGAVPAAVLGEQGQLDQRASPARRRTAPVGSDRGARPGLLPVGFPGPPAAPDVHVSAHRALHVSCPLVSRASRLPVSGSMGSRWCCRGSGSESR